MKQQVTTLAKFASLLTLSLITVSTTLQAGNDARERVFAPNSTAQDKSLRDWLSTYWRWYYSGADMSQSRVGNVQLMPLPAGEYISGSFTPDDPGVLRGRLEITLEPGTPFVLPLFAWVREMYGDGSTDPALDDALILANAHPAFTINGTTVVSDDNKAAYYVPVTAFDPIVTYPAPTEYGSVAAVSFQGVGVVAKPLPKGTHTIHLYEPIIIPAGAYAGLPDGIGIIFDNTWTVTVK